MKKILIIEDDNLLCQELERLLKSALYDPCVLKDFENPIGEILKMAPQLILLDINLPYQNGELLLQELRKKSNVPVIMLTSRNSSVDEVLSMSYGADDYITKPYNPNILLLRIAAILKRVGEIKDVCTYKELEINLQKGILKRGNIEIILTKNEMIIFHYLLNHAQKIVTRDELMTDLWDNQEYINDNTLTVNMSRLRAKLKQVGYDNLIETRKGMGYLLV